MAAKKMGPTPAELPTTSERAAREASTELGGETVRFAPPPSVFEGMQWPLDAKLEPVRAPRFREVWLKAHVSPLVWGPQSDVTISEAALERAKTRSLDEVPTAIDLELESYTLYAAAQRSLPSGLAVQNVAANALALWTSLEGPLRAADVALAAFALRPFAASGILGALRDHARIHGLEALAPAYRAATEGDDRSRALLLDDLDAAERLRRASTGDAVGDLAPLVGLFEDPVITGALITAISERPPVLRTPAILRAVRRHGIALAAPVLAHVERVMDDPGHRDTERAPWLSVLACYPSARAARLATRLLGSKAARPAVIQTLATMKPEAVSVLTAQKAGKGKPSEAARAALEELG